MSEEEKKREELKDFDDVDEILEERQGQEKVMEFDLGGKYFEVVVRGLKRKEWEKFEDEISSRFSGEAVNEWSERNKYGFEEDEEIDDPRQKKIMKYAKRFYFEHGIVESPDNFDIEMAQKYPAIIYHEITNTINDLSNLGVESEESFC